MKKYIKIFISIILYALISIGILFFVENIFRPAYIYTLSIKFILFVVLPLLILRWFKLPVNVLGRFTHQVWKIGIPLGIIAGMGIGIAYYALQGSIDWNTITQTLEQRHITQTTFILVFLYIMLGNSLIEEVFFRGFIFKHTAHISKVFAYIFSSLLFALYHLSIFNGWFEGIALFLSIFGLFIGGMLFAYLYDKTKGIWATYIFHILCDLVILVIGYTQLFIS